MRMSLIAPPVAVVALCAAIGPARATESPGTVRTYVVTSVGESPAGRVTASERLSLDPGGGRPRVRLDQADGSVFIAPVALTPQGQLALPSQDRAVTCYNMAMGVLGAQNVAGAQPVVDVAFVSALVQIPLRVRSTFERGAVRRIVLDGSSAGTIMTSNTVSPAGITIDALVTAESGVLRSATFTETNYVNDRSNVVGRSTCTIERTPTTAIVTRT